MHTGGSLCEHSSFLSRLYQSNRIREQLLFADISVDHLVQPPLPKQSHQEPIAQDHVQVTFEHLQGGTLDSPSNQPVSAISHPSVLRRKAECKFLFSWLRS